MPADNTALITLGPFAGLDVHSADAFEKANFAISNSNVDTSKKLGALSSASGRVQLFNFSMLGVSNSIAALTRYDVAPNIAYFIACGVTPITGYFCLQTPTLIGTLPLITTPWFRAVQSNGKLYLDNGYQIFYGADNNLHSAQWQYFAPSGFTAEIVSTQPASGLASATYSYAFVTVIALPTYGAATYQQTTPYYLPSNVQYVTAPNGNITYQLGTLVIPPTLNSFNGVQLTGTFSGFTIDGLPFTTDIYRMSSNTNVFQLLKSGVTGSTYVDSAADASIAANQQLILNRDPPPTGITDIGPTGAPTENNNPIESMNNRMWVLAREQNPNTLGVPQSQLWYSEVGQEWSFDATLQVLLVNNENTTPVGTSAPGILGLVYGDQPNALCALGSQIMVFGLSSTSEVYGTDETNFIALPLFKNVGCVAPFSVTKIKEGTIAWLAGPGAFVYNQAQLEDISTEKLRNYLDTIPASNWSTAVGSFRRNIWFLSFPQSNVTLTYYFPEKAWNILPYAMSAGVFCCSIPNDLLGTKFEQIVGARPGTNYIDFWQDSDSDLGAPITLNWTSPLMCGNSWEQKTYRALSIAAPPQPTIVTVSLIVDPGYASSPPVWTSDPINLALAPTSKICNIPNLACKGYAAQVVISATNTGTQPIEIWEVVIGGTMDREWAVNG